MDLTCTWLHSSCVRVLVAVGLLLLRIGYNIGYNIVICCPRIDRMLHVTCAVRDVDRELFAVYSSGAGDCLLQIPTCREIL